ncbi:unnamed protein product [Schistosoma curassoni]|uniref:Uncharacterized protein n=1 Tax=Schistosoma curassoni TaxID=6186 RepID=A0A183KR88_9TREM|nr:unnamed protein product [Schistosoma curassoni]
MWQLSRSWTASSINKEDLMEMQMLTSNPEGKQKRGMPKITLHQELEADMKRMNSNWKEQRRIAQDKFRWRMLVSELWFSMIDNKHKQMKVVDAFRMGLGPHIDLEQRRSIGSLAFRQRQNSSIEYVDADAPDES